MNQTLKKWQKNLILGQILAKFRPPIFFAGFTGFYRFFLQVWPKFGSTNFFLDVLPLLVVIYCSKLLFNAI